MIAPQARVLRGDCAERLRDLDADLFDSVVTDPPYGLKFMGQSWDYSVPSEVAWREVLRVLKPGAHLLCFSGTRTQHRMAAGIEAAGFEIRDVIAWAYGTGFPKSVDVGRAAGTPQWSGWGTALKPAMELITMARKPFSGSVASNVRALGVGAINLGGCAVPDQERKRRDRHPANIIHDGGEDALSALGAAARFFYCPKASTEDRDDGLDAFPLRESKSYEGGRIVSADHPATAKGGAATRRNTHPTVKPTELMRYLCKLVTPPGGVVLDPYLGSGSTGRGAILEGFSFVGVELDESHANIAEARIAAALEKLRASTSKLGGLS